MDKIPHRDLRENSKLGQGTRTSLFRVEVTKS